MTPRSNAALCATSTSEPMKPPISGNSSPNRGASSTMDEVMPWIAMLRESKWSWPTGGRMSQDASSTTRPSRTFVRPTAHGEPRKPFAVSKSMAVNAIPTIASLPPPPRLPFTGS